MKGILLAGLVSLSALSGTASATSYVLPNLFSFQNESAFAAQISFLAGAATPIRFIEANDPSIALEIIPSPLISGSVENFDPPPPGGPINLTYVPASGGFSGDESVAGDNTLNQNAFRIGLDSENAPTVSQIGPAVFEFSFDQIGTGGNLYGGTFTISDLVEIGSIPAPVPVPAAGIMMLSAIAGMFVVGRRQSQRKRQDAGSMVA